MGFTIAEAIVAFGTTGESLVASKVDSVKGSLGTLGTAAGTASSSAMRVLGGIANAAGGALAHVTGNLLGGMADEASHVIDELFNGGQAAATGFNKELQGNVRNIAGVVSVALGTLFPGVGHLAGTLITAAAPAIVGLLDKMVHPYREIIALQNEKTARMEENLRLAREQTAAAEKEKQAAERLAEIEKEREHRRAQADARKPVSARYVGLEDRERVARGMSQAESDIRNEAQFLEPKEFQRVVADLPQKIAAVEHLESLRAAVTAAAKETPFEELIRHIGELNEAFKSGMDGMNGGVLARGMEDFRKQFEQMIGIDTSPLDEATRKMDMIREMLSAGLDPRKAAEYRDSVRDQYRKALGIEDDPQKAMDKRLAALKAGKEAGAFDSEEEYQRAVAKAKGEDKQPAVPGKPSAGFEFSGFADFARKIQSGLQPKDPDIARTAVATEGTARSAGQVAENTKRIADGMKNQPAPQARFA